MHGALRDCSPQTAYSSWLVAQVKFQVGPKSLIGIQGGKN